MYPVVTRMPGESYHQQLGSLLLRLSVVFQVQAYLKSAY